ncbi:MAG: 4-hydroxy-tetrahydrodipicolinate synthase [Pseudomonadota bacterium]|nr:4-hydroxy-tetrahydrodipicolinate synthase [Pseudomonadota bacterium]MDE3037503.1 4-hydroxy-tetrahydrodipicolinate synthase [Pseudomonadota bacterium]
MSFQGIYTALITPFKNGKVDEKAFQDFVEWQIREGVHGLVPCGTTGESPTLSHAEHNRVIDLCLEVARGRVPVMAGTGSNSTDEAIMMTKHARKAGAAGALVVAPYYNKPTQEGIFQHYRAIAEAAKLPIIIYNIPGRSVINISDDTLARLAALPYIAGVKDATGDLARPYTLKARLPKKAEKFAMLSGEDMTAVAFNASGGRGCISVSANIAPRACAAVQEACLEGDYAKALALHSKLVDLHNIMFCETSPSPVKYAASLLGKCRPEVRLPLVMPQEDHKKSIAQVLKKLRLL